MSIIKALTKKLNSKTNNSNELDIFYKTFLRLSHDLKNNLITIRAYSGYIKHSFNANEISSMTPQIENALSGIEKKIDHSNTALNAIATIICPYDHWINDTQLCSITDCINETVQSYPFLSAKHASYINIENSTVDFSVTGNKQLIKTVFYCLINNAMNNIFSSSEGMINIQVYDHKVCFKFPTHSKNTALSESNLFTLGLPKNPKNGFNFIAKAIKNMNGDVGFKQESTGNLIVTLAFPTPR